MRVIFKAKDFQWHHDYYGDPKWIKINVEKTKRLLEHAIKDLIEVVYESSDTESKV